MNENKTEKTVTKPLNRLCPKSLNKGIALTDPNVIKAKSSVITPILIDGINILFNFLFPCF
jgi:hypothetical protein